MPAFVVVSGLPASGKTTVASALAAALHFPLFDKDAFLECLFDHDGIGDSKHRRALSMRADVQFRDAALSVDQAVVSSWWRHPKSVADSGTSTEWLSRPSHALVEVHCVCAAPIAAARFVARARHPGHLDASRSPEDVLGMFRQQERFGPLFPDRAIAVDTEHVVTLPELVGVVKSALDQQSP